MTEREVKRILRVWMRRLRLSHWVLVVTFDPDERYEAFVAVGDYLEGDLNVSGGSYRDWTPRHTNEVLVHELLHLHTRDLYHAALEVNVALGKQAAAVHRARLDHELEGAVDNLAVLIVELAGLA
jgi:hypothetical protein